MNVIYIPVLIASTGSNREAEIAGIIPDIKPINVDKAKPRKILKNDKINSNSKTELATKETNQTNTIPMKPPIIDNITASNKN